MPQEQWAQAVAASVAPVVIISASALLCLALYNRLAAIINRLRAVQRERLHVQERLEAMTQKELDHGTALRLNCIQESLAHQTSRIRHRARLIRDSLLCLLAAIASLVLCSLINGVTVFFAILAPVGAVMFVLGLVMLFTSLLYAAQELIFALAPAELETDIVSELTGTDSPDHRHPGGPARKVRSAMLALAPGPPPH